MKATVKFDDSGKKELTEDVKKKAKQIVAKKIAQVLFEAQKVIPKATGSLAKSYTDDVAMNGGEVTGELIFRMPYARKQDEDELGHYGKPPKNIIPHGRKIRAEKKSAFPKRAWKKGGVRLATYYSHGYTDLRNILQKYRSNYLTEPFTRLIFDKMNEIAEEIKEVLK